MPSKYSNTREPRQVTKEDIAEFQPGDYLEVVVQLFHYVDNPDGGTYDGYEEPCVMKGVLKESESHDRNKHGSNKKTLCMPNGQLVRGISGEPGSNLVRIVKHESAKEFGKV
jgi:hypothetical protein